MLTVSTKRQEQSCRQKSKASMGSWAGVLVMGKKNAPKKNGAFVMRVLERLTYAFLSN